MLSEYLQVQIFITTYFLAVAIFGAWSVSLCRSPARECPPGEIPWAFAGWYKLRPGDYAPLFRSSRTDRCVYIHKDTLVYPTEAAVNRRYISDLPSAD